jgi:hypothetical protein
MIRALKGPQPSKLRPDFFKDEGGRRKDEEDEGAAISNVEVEGRGERLFQISNLKSEIPN